MPSKTITVEKFTGEAPNTVHKSGMRVFSGRTHKLYYFRLRAANGEIIAASEAYTRKSSRDKTVRLLLTAKLVGVK